MATPTPAEESIELFNTLLCTAPSDQDAVQRILWRGRQLERKRPNDFRIRVLLATACALGEDPRGALAAIERIGELWVGQDTEPLISYLSILMGLWELERATQVAKSLLATPALNGNHVVLGLAVECAIGIGNGDWLAELSDLKKKRPGSREAADALDVVEQSGLREHLSRHQELVRKHVAGTACLTAHAVFGVEDDAPFIATNVFAAADRATCRRIERDISESLATYYESQGLPPGVYIPYFTTIVSPLATAAPAFAAA